MLRVISVSPGELEPVSRAMLENAVRICEAHSALYRYVRTTAFASVALHGAPASIQRRRARASRIIRSEPAASALIAWLQTKRVSPHR